MYISTGAGCAQQAAMKGMVHFPFLNQGHVLLLVATDGPWEKVGAQVLPVGRYSSPIWLCFAILKPPPLLCYICFLFIKFPVWIPASAFLMSTTAFITDNNFLLQKGCIILHALQSTFYEQTLKYSIWQYA
jgi:hypothetical protein